MKKIEAKFATTYTCLSTLLVGKWRINKQIKPLATLGLLALSGLFSQALATQTQRAHYSSEELQALSQREQRAMNNASPVMDINPVNLIEQARQFEQQSKTQLDAALSPVLEKAKQHNPAADAKGIMVFASLSMPRTSLIQLLMQSADLQVPIIIRGVQPQGFTATIKQMNALINHQGQIINSGFAINPQWFTQFGITQVPAFVAIKPGKCHAKQPCSQDDFDVLYGNVSLYDALSLLSQHGNVPDIAGNALSQHRLIEE
ncbi:type-F conjugative transfer system pilin assembly protein TrbC [Shewanella benthica]|nr:type-F conjugative transfer system pilin assembly protein TrbC [Shewanella benthica]